MTQGSATPLPAPKERRRLREARALTQAELASRLGVSRSTVRSWETGRTTPRGRKLEAYVRLLGVGTTLSDDAVSGRQEGSVPALVGAGAPPPSRENRASENRRASEDRTADGAEPAEHADRGAVDRDRDRDRPGGEGEWGDADQDSAVREPSLTPAQAFDALYAFAAPALVRQTYLLTGRRELARESVERAFQLAWYRWPEVAVDRDPAGWVRATAYEYALSPWHRLRPRYRHPEAPPAGGSERALLDVLLTLPPVYRRTLLLYDGVGLGLPETAAETEASTPAAANRVLHAREAVAARLPELALPEDLHRRLTELGSAERLRAAKPRTVRHHGEHRARQWTRAAIAFTVLLIGVTALTLRTAPDHYEAPLSPPETIHGLPPRSAPGPLSAEELVLRAKLRSQTSSGPERLVPEIR
ncbi:helix-turn-helix domain-containing protein [Streptomyces sp. NBC_01558]|uniref:helix-turn-helix domain-containing protein n=1 Tax=Streptomyces sp. NBC_01558 TaxID=2975878 RepID=UPI002DDC83E9|nr:helix-turn-helix domain-containing protein [Streptomyces sp. NBC_01558]WSD78020.1 helix-turn-helix domain-containing protein [Streptomyces sp. NBC_01558]